jgi:hypothetical protein
MLYSVRSERLLMEQIDYSVLFRWFVGMNMDDEVWDVTVFTKNRDRLLDGDVAREFFVVGSEPNRGTSDEHFTVDGTLVEASAGLKSFQPKDQGKQAPPPDDPGNPTVNAGRRRTGQRQADRHRRDDPGSECSVAIDRAARKRTELRGVSEGTGATVWDCNTTREDLAGMDRKRKRKGSNEEWVNPHEPDARITKMKDGGTHLAHTEHAVDMDTGAVITVRLQKADLGDTTVKETLAEAGTTVADYRTGDRGATDGEAAGACGRGRGSRGRQGISQRPGAARDEGRRCAHIYSREEASRQTALGRQRRATRCGLR